MLEPFVFQAKFTAADGRAMALNSDCEPGTVHVHRVPAGAPLLRCALSLLCPAFCKLAHLSVLFS